MTKNNEAQSELVINGRPKAVTLDCLYRRGGIDGTGQERGVMNPDFPLDRKERVRLGKIEGLNNWGVENGES